MSQALSYQIQSFLIVYVYMVQKISDKIGRKRKLSADVTPPTTTELFRVN